MKLFSTIILTVLITAANCGVFDNPVNADLLKVAIDYINSFSGTLEEFKEAISAYVPVVTLTYSSEETNEILDELCAGINENAVIECEELKSFVDEESWF